MHTYHAILDPLSLHRISYDTLCLLEHFTLILNHTTYHMFLKKSLHYVTNIQNIWFQFSTNNKTLKEYSI